MAFSYYKSLTLTKPASDLTNYPVCVGIDGNVYAADADLKSVGNGGYVQSSSGYDVYFYSDSSLTTRLAAEREVYSASAGTGVWWVKVPTVSSSVNTVIYIAFGDATISSDPNSDGTYGTTSTWNSAYKAVYHLGDGTTLSGADATNTNNGTVTSATATTGNIDGGASFNGSTGRRVLISDSASFTFSDFTISCWINSSSSNTQLITEQLGTQAWGLYTTGGTLHGFATQSSGQDDSAGTNVCTGAWVHISWVRDTGNSIRRFYVNGSDVAHPADTQGGTINATDSVVIGERYNGGTEQFAFTGTIDEMRFCNAVRSPDWVLADYNSQKASSTWITFGARTSTGGGASTPTYGTNRLLIGVGI